MTNSLQNRQDILQDRFALRLTARLSSGAADFLNGKVLDLAIREAVNRLVEGIDSGAWNLKTSQ